jgi:putative ABC transport system ATP-binding protein
MSTISCRDLCKTFHQGEETIVALDHVCLDIAEGSFVCLSGPSGSGKTTLLNALGGLDTPDSGAITVGGRRVDLLSKSELADMRLNSIGFVFQAYNLIPVLSARENVEFVMQVQGVPARERHGIAAEMLAEVGLAGMEGRLPAELSGGQQQRVAVARAIASKPALVLADEPTANLDTRSAAQLMELFVELNTQREVTFVISTHDTRVMGYARRLISMRDGLIVGDEAQQPQPMAL